ncbi:hypothetical protein [Clostridium beijerinckii]|uniref:hypothetical protein n=1 Tax=Clostridium beijerinckii TaxID=1520 RepID=UPI0003D2E527|nr:hypothetical protein [Clostridium beijerinckii]
MNYQNPTIKYGIVILNVVVEKKLKETLNKVSYNWHKKHKLCPSCYKILNEEIIEVEQ